MKKLKYILLLFPLLISAQQLHLNVGVLDIQDRRDGTALSWNVGYAHYFKSFGVGTNYRYSQMLWDNYFTAELTLKYRVEERNYRFDAGVGAGYNFDDFDIHPLVTLRNSFKIDEGTWINIDLDNAYRNSKENYGGGWRFETYLLVGLSLDVDWVKKPRRPKRFF